MQKLTATMFATLLLAGFVNANKGFLQSNSSPFRLKYPKSRQLQQTTEDMPTVQMGEDVSSTGITYSEHLPCFPCIMSDHIFCVEAPDHQHVEEGEDPPESVCCSDITNCPERTKAGWTCSDSYSDKLMSLRMCPFEHQKCGNQSEIIFSNAGDKLDQNLTLYPGDVCFYTLRTECGSPSFDPQGADQAEGIDIFTIEYDDQDLDTEVVPVNGSSVDIIFPNSNTTTTVRPRIPLPKKRENFDDSKKDLSGSDSYLLRFENNANGTTTYYYSNGTVYLYEPSTVTSFGASDPRDFEVQYMNGTIFTYYKDGSIKIVIPGASDIIIPAPQEYSYEDSAEEEEVYNINGTRRRLQDTNSTESKPWGTVVFYMDGRIREILANGTSIWNNQFYDSSINPNTTSNSSLNTTAHLRIRVYMNGSYILNWANGEINDFTWDTTWAKFYFYNKADLARQIKSSELDVDGGKVLNFYNGTERYYFPPPNSKYTLYENATAPLYEDKIPPIPECSPDTFKTVRRVYRNGTIAYVCNNSQFIVLYNPVGAAEKDFKRMNYTDGSYTLLYEDGRKVFYPPPPKDGINSTYEIATALLSIEALPDGTNRLVYTNGTVVISNPVTGETTYEHQLNSTFNETDVIPINNCSYVLVDNVNMTKTLFMCLPTNTWTPKAIALAIVSDTTFRDGSHKIVYVNGTVARFGPDGKLAFYEVPPKSFYVEYPVMRNPDGSIVIDFTSVNGTKRFIPPPLPVGATIEQRQMALIFRDTYPSSQKAYYFNGTIAVFSGNGVFQYYEVPPKWFIGGCRPSNFTDGRPMLDCTQVNQTRQVFFPPQTFRNTQFENATAPIMDEYYPDGLYIRYYRNGTQVKFNPLGQIVAVIVPPTSLATPPADFIIQDQSSGVRTIQYTNGTLVTFNAPLNNNTPRFEVATGYLYKVKRPDLGSLTTFYRNGSVYFLDIANQTGFWIVAPLSYFVDFNEQINNDGSRKVEFTNGTIVSEFPPSNENETEFQKATAIQRIVNFGNGTEIYSYRNGTVAIFEQGQFSGYIIPPRSIFVDIRVEHFPDGSYVKYFSNGTKIWFAPPPPKNETVQMRAFRVIRIESDTNLNKDIYFFANGTVVLFVDGQYNQTLVKPISYVVTSTITITPDGGFIEEFSNGTVVQQSAPIDERADEIKRSRYVTREEKNQDGSGKRYFLNGTVIATRYGAFVSYIVRPKSFYYGCVKEEEINGIVNVRCWNGTKLIYYPPQSGENDEQRATALAFSEYQENNYETYKNYYRNGTIAVMDYYTSTVVYYQRPPAYFYSANSTSTQADGSKVIEFQNGTKVTFFPPPPKEATPYERATAQRERRVDSNGSVEIKFYNGTHIQGALNADGTITNIKYIVYPPAFVQQGADQSVQTTFTNGTTRKYYPALDPTATEDQKAVAPSYSDLYSNGSYTIVYFNGTVALYDAQDHFLGYLKKPEYFLGELNRTDFPDGSFAISYFNNKTVRYFPVPPAATATDREKACAPLYFDKFSNGTMRKVFANGTIAVYHNGVFMRYDAKPREMYKEADYPVEEKEDGSKTVYYPNGTVRVYEPETSPIEFRDCESEDSCTIHFRNGSIAQTSQGQFTWVQNSNEPLTPSGTTARVDPSYTYVNKAGPKKQAYDKSQGGVKKYKEEYQNNDKRALKSEPAEPLCKGRNQMIIMGDWRTRPSFYGEPEDVPDADDVPDPNDEPEVDDGSRRLQTSTTGSQIGPNTLALQMQSVDFVPDHVSSSAITNLLAASALLLSLAFAFF